jgi:hypothetical protein
LNAFGPEFNDLTPARYQRLLRRGRWLDEHGHLVMEAMYPPEEASLDDLDFYAHYLLTNHPEGLLAFCFREEPSEEELREALLRSLDAVRQLASACDELDCWRDKYFFDRTAFDLRWRDESVNAVFGADDLRSIFRCLSRVPRRVRAVYNAVGPQVLELLDRHGDLAEEEGALVRGPAYAAAVCHANAYVRDRLLEEAPEGLLDSGCHLRLDDDRQAGGIWRCERIEDYTSLTTIPPTIPLHLGFGEASPDFGLRFADADPEPIAISVHGFRVALTKRDLSLGRLRLPERVVEVLGASDKVVLRLRHEGEQDDQDVSLGPGGRTLIGTTWPLSFFPGLIVHCNVERGGSVVKVHTKELSHPLTIDDVELHYEFDEAVYRRETQEQLPEDELIKAPTINDLIHRTFRARGHQTEDGGRTLTGVEIITIILGPGWKPGEARPIIAALQRLGLEYRQGEYVWRPRVTRRTSALDRTVLAAYGGEGSRRELSSIIRRHLVPMHLRRLRGKHKRPSAEKVSGYAKARSQFGFQGVLPPDLPHGYTWVEPHERGGHVEEALGAEH